MAHYEKIADAPDAVTRLRRFVLDLAVRGKLVPQDANDEPASELLKRIAKEKARLVKAGEIKLERPSSTCTADLSIELRNGWAATCLSQITACLDYRRVPVNGNEREARIAGKTQQDLFPYYGATQQQGWIDDFLFDGEFILLGEDGVPFKDPFRTKAYLITARSWVNNHAHVFQAILTSPRFLVHYLNVFDYAGRVVGATRAKLNQAQAMTIPVPLPPLNEQNRIVAKVDELMGLCDRLDAARVSREAVRDKLMAASLARLNAPDPETFQADARFALDALPLLTTRAGHIKVLRQTILNLAVRGKLVPQDADDEPTSELLKRIAKERVRSRHRAISIKPEDEPYTVPETWKWVALDHLIVEGPQNGISPKPTKREGAPKAITLTATTSGTFNPAYFKHVEANIPVESDFWLKDGDLLFQRGNTREYVGIAAVYRGPANTFLFPDLIMKVRVSEHVCLDYAHLVSISPPARYFFSVNASGAQATMPKINQTTLVSLPIPLAPLAEQKRIVAKVEALMALCDRLEASLTAAATARRFLLNALLAEALASVEDRELEAAE